MEQLKEKVNVVVTGFGPFENHEVNASWMAVSLLPRLFKDVDGVHLTVTEVPVVYREVDSVVPRLWSTHRPTLMVHVGVSSIATALTLEQVAHNTGYIKKDAEGNLPIRECFSEDGNDLVAGLSMSEVRKAVINAVDIGVDAAVSMDPGRFLCDYIFYTSLQQNKNTSAFIHVPPLNQPYSASHLARSIRVAILDMLRQLKY